MPIPVRIRIDLSDFCVQDLTRSLRQIVHATIAQRRDAETDQSGKPARAAASTLFDIVEVSVENLPRIATTVESLECLARLAQLGIRVLGLPVIVDPDRSAEQLLPIVRSLQVLIPSSRGEPTARCVENVFVTDSLPSTFMPAFFSAVQVSRQMKCVELDTRFDPRENDDPMTLNHTLAMWKWAMYALFSRHAGHNVVTSKLHVDYLDEQVLCAITEVLNAENPLGVLFDSAVEKDEWIQAPRFYTQDPGESCGDERALFCPSEPLLVRVITKIEREHAIWWRVLLPGCGEAWVNDEDAVDIKEGAVGFALGSETKRIQSSRGVHIQLDGVYLHNASDVLSLLRLVARNVWLVEVEAVKNQEEEFDMTEWVLELVGACPKLEGLGLPWYAQMKRFCGLVEAAEAGPWRLNVLSVRHPTCTDSTDLIDFMEVLCDANHPLTRRLEVFTFAVEVPDTPTRDFGSAWQRLLRHNRKLHTITLRHYGYEYVETDQEPVAVRTGPLRMTSKAAFLSVLRENPKDRTSARSRIDASVIAIIFAFAAPHRLRKVEVEYHAPEEEMEPPTEN